MHPTAVNEPRETTHDEDDATLAVEILPVDGVGVTRVPRHTVQFLLLGTVVFEAGFRRKKTSRFAWFTCFHTHSWQPTFACVYGVTARGHQKPLLGSHGDHLFLRNKHTVKAVDRAGLLCLALALRVFAHQRLGCVFQVNIVGLAHFSTSCFTHTTSVWR